MTHIDEDTLLKSVLEILDEPEETTVRDHLSSCAGCRQKLSELQRNIAALGAVDFPVIKETPRQMAKTTPLSLRVLRAAAVLAVGFLGGYVTAELSNPGQPIVVAQNFVPAPVAAPVTQYVSCEQVDISY
jgi:anti-sigma factor RsiW